MMIKELELVEKRDLNLVMELGPDCLKLGMLKVTSEFLQLVRGAQEKDEFLSRTVELLARDKAPDFNKGTDGILRFRGRICVPSDEELKKTILEETHKSSDLFFVVLEKITKKC